MNMSLQKGTMFKGNVIWTNRQFLEAEDMVIFREIVFCFVAKVGLITPFITYTGYRSYWVWGPPCNNFHASLGQYTYSFTASFQLVLGPTLQQFSSRRRFPSHPRCFWSLGSPDRFSFMASRPVSRFPEKNKAPYEKPFMCLRRGTLGGVGRWVPAMNFWWILESGLRLVRECDALSRT